MGQHTLLEGQQLVIGGEFNRAVAVIKGQYTLRSDHEEADTRLLLHAKHASEDHERIVIQSPDTDVVLLCVSLY